jgi:hypothetical protein
VLGGTSILANTIKESGNIQRAGQPSATYARDNILGTVSDSGGVPSGAVIETGANANGTYVRYADGTQMCWNTFSENIAIATGLLGGFRDTGRTWTYPAMFVGGASIQVSSGSTGAFGGFATGTTGNNGCSIFSTAITTQTASARVINVMAAGRWKA